MYDYQLTVAKVIVLTIVVIALFHYSFNTAIVLVIMVMFAIMSLTQLDRGYGVRGGARSKHLVQAWEMELYHRLDGRQLPNPPLKPAPAIAPAVCTTSLVDKLKLAPYVYIRDARGYPVREVRADNKSHEQLYRLLQKASAGKPINTDVLDKHWYSNSYRFIQYGDVLPLKHGKSDLINMHIREYKPLHWGQRKLLMSEIDFLLRCPDQPWTVVYPGSAHGNHLFVIMDLFPKIKLMLWDPAIYNSRLVQLDRHRRGLDELPRELERYRGRVWINPELDGERYDTWHRNSNVDAKPWLNYKDQLGFFTEDSIEWVKARGEPMLFISDIRLVEPQSHRLVERAREITNPYNPYVLEHLRAIANMDYHRDMQLQQEWFTQLGADYGLLKMRLPNQTDGKPVEYTYLDGTALLQCWSNIPSGETRLLVERGAAQKQWDVSRYWSKLGYFHRACRQGDYSKVSIGSFTVGEIWPWTPGWDCWMETDIWARYLGQNATADRVRSLVAQITDSLFGSTHTIAVGSLEQIPHALAQQFQKRLDYQSRKYDLSV